MQGTDGQAGIRNRAIPALLGLFAASALALRLVHEPWRDEAQAWLVARDAPSPAAFFGQMGYEGSGALWHILLVPLARWGLPYESMGVLHVGLAAGTIAILLFFGPWNPLERFLLPFGYFLLYEYSAIARSYVLAGLLLAALAAHYPSRHGRPLTHGFFLLLLASSNIHGFLLALVLLGPWVREAAARHDRGAFAGPVVAMVGLGLAAAQMWPPGDLSDRLAGWHFELSWVRLEHALESVVHAFLPIPQIDATFFDSNVTQGLPWLQVPLSIVFLHLVWRALRGDRRSRLLFALAASGLLAFSYLKFEGAVRHHGILFLFFLYMVWVSRLQTPAVPARLTPSVHGRRPSRVGVFALLLMLQAAGAIVPAVLEPRERFSAGEDAARHLRTIDPAPDWVLTYHSFGATSLLPYLAERYPSFYALETEANLTYIQWTDEFDAGSHLNESELAERIERCPGAQAGARVWILLNERATDEGFLARYPLRAAFEGTVVPDEAIYVHERI